MMLILVILLPIITGFLVLLPPSRELAIRSILPVAALPAVLQVITGSAPEVEIPELILGLRLGWGSYGRTFLAAASLVWLASSLFTRAYMADRPRLTSFVFYFCLTMSGNFGLILARDIPSFYTFFALMTYAAYGLIVHERDPETLLAGKVYLIMAVIGEAAVILAICVAASAAPGIGIEDIAPALQASPWRGVILTAAFFGFGVKAGAFLMHFWLPLAHPAAPSPASAVLSGSMIKAGLLGWLYFFPGGTMDFYFWGIVFVCSGAVALFYGVIIGLLQSRPKSILAYSSISQMGLMTLTLGMGLYDHELWQIVLPVLLLLVLNHSLSKGVLFLVAGTAESCQRKDVSGMVLTAASLLPVLALAGFPWTAGAAVKQGVKKAAAAADIPWPADPALIFGLSAVATALLLGHFLVRLQQTMNPEGGRLPIGLWLPWVILLPLLAGVVAIASSITGMESAIEKMTRYDLWSTAWPVVTGLALALVYQRLFCGRWVLPDYHPWGWVTRRLHPLFGLFFQTLLWLEERKSRLIRAFWLEYAALFGKGEDSHRVFIWLEQRLRHWHTAGLMFAALLTVFILLTLFTGRS